MTGGACNAEGSQSTSHSSNPMKMLINDILLGKSRVNEKIRAYNISFPGDNPDKVPFLKQQQQPTGRQSQEVCLPDNKDKKIMEKQWYAERVISDEMKKIESLEQRKVWEENQLMMRRTEGLQQRKAYDESQVRITQRLQGWITENRFLADQWRRSQPHYESRSWNNEPTAEEESKSLDKNVNAAPIKISKEGDCIEICKKAASESANQTIQSMRNDPDPRFQKSKLLSFLEKLQSGELEIKQNQLIENKEIDEQKDLESAWEEAIMEDAWEEEKAVVEGRCRENLEKNEEMFEDIWDMAQAQELEPEESVEKEFEEVFDQVNQGNMADVFAEMWNVDQEVEEYEDDSNKLGDYEFSSNNPYINDNQALTEASKLLDKGRTRSAILALEAHLQRHPDDGNSWRVLGKLLIDNDEDSPAIKCFLNSVRIDGSNLDSLLTLGISSANILDEVQAMNYLRQWMMNNTKFQSIKISPEVNPTNTATANIDINVIKAMNAQLLEEFEAARSIDPSDPELLTSLAVLHFVAKDYTSSLKFFNEALKYDSKNYSLWNKLGATLAHLGRNDEAIEAYHQALEFKPNYVRGWVNLGIAHVYKFEFEEATELFLNALSINPNAKHVWSYLHTPLISLQRYDLLESATTHNLEGFRGEFNIVTLENLPPPEVEYKQLNEQFLIQKKSEDWVNEFN